MKKHIIQSAKIIILGLILAGGFAFAQTANPPSGNIAAPINAGHISQLKAGAFGVGSATGPLTVVGDANFYDNVRVEDFSSPATPINLTMATALGIGVSDDPTISPTPNIMSTAGTGGGGYAFVNGAVKVRGLAHANTPPSSPNLREVCIDSTGVLYLCAIPTPSPCHGSQTYSNPGSSTFTIPACATSMTVKVWGAGGGAGGGGGGSAAGSDGSGGAGGAGGGYSTRTIAISGAQNFTVVVGAGGVGAPGGGPGQTAGGTSTFQAGNGGLSSFSGPGISLVSNGGVRGGGAAYNQAGIGQPGGTASGGTTNTSGSPGDNGLTSGNGCSGQGGFGAGPGAGGSGGGGAGGVAICSGHAAGNPGSAGGWGVGGGGGGGGKSNLTNSHSGGNGGNGGPGRVEISW